MRKTLQTAALCITLAALPGAVFAQSGSLTDG